MHFVIIPIFTKICFLKNMYIIKINFELCDICYDTIKYSWYMMSNHHDESSSWYIVGRSIVVPLYSSWQSYYFYPKYANSFNYSFYFCYSFTTSAIDINLFKKWTKTFYSVYCELWAQFLEVVIVNTYVTTKYYITYENVHKITEVIKYTSWNFNIGTFFEFVCNFGRKSKGNPKGLSWIRGDTECRTLPGICNNASLKNSLW